MKQKKPAGSKPRTEGHPSHENESNGGPTPNGEGRHADADEAEIPEAPECSKPPSLSPTMNRPPRPKR